MIPMKAKHPYGAETWMNYYYDPQVAAKLAAYVNYFCPVQGAKEVLQRTDPKLAANPLIFPDAATQARLQGYPPVSPADERELTAADAEGHGGLSGGVLTLRRRRALLPYVLLAPGVLWLVVFFAVPVVNQLWVSLQTGNADTGFSQTYNWSVYPDSISAYTSQLQRSFGYAAAATVLCLVISFPLAYFIAFKSGRWKNVLLLLIVLPFFTSYIVRTVAWQTILADDGWVLHRAQDVGLVAHDGRLLATRTAVIAGITYNFLPFMALPLYVALEKIDRRLVEAATDLYASRATAFRKVTLPLALPGVFAGTLLTFIPALGDFINAQLLGSSQQYMIGNVIQSQFLVVRDYPVAAALSFVLMAVILVGIAIYARALGTQSLRESVA